MQIDINRENLTAPLETPRLWISAEVLAYVLVILLAGGLRFLQLGSVPLNDVEAHEAIAALHRVTPEHPQLAETIFPTNSLGAAFNMLSFTLLGHGDAAARGATAVAGILLTLSPILYRRWIGRSGALLIVTGLAVSPVAVAASRTMGGMVWASLLLMVAGWLALRFWEGRHKGDALAATVCGAGVLLLTTPVGILLLLGALIGLLVAVAYSRSDDPIRQRVPEVSSAWPGFEALAAALIAVVIVSTIFFLFPSGLSSVSQLPEIFYTGLSERQPGAMVFYPLLVSLRYDAAFVLFALIGIYKARRSSTFAERFLTANFVWGLLCLTFYAGGTADMALMVTLPAIGLTASAVLRFLEPSRAMFWDVPPWLVPAQVIMTAALVAIISVSVQSASYKVETAAKVNTFAPVLDLDMSKFNNVQISTLQPEAESSRTLFSLPYEQFFDCRDTEDGRDPATLREINEKFCKIKVTDEVTIQVEPIDSSVEETLVSAYDASDILIYGPERLGDGLAFTVHSVSSIPSEHRIELQRVPGQTSYGQYYTTLYLDNLVDKNGLDELRSGAFRLRIPLISAFTTISLRSPNPRWMFAVLFGVMSIPILFFLSGATFGADASTRSVMLGLLLFLVIYGVALGLDATSQSEGDIRELWNRQALSSDYHNVRDTLTEYSLRDNGTRDSIAVTVQAPIDGALAWALQGFPNAQFVEQIHPTTNTAAILAPDVQPRPVVEAEYIGQQLVLDYAWDYDSLAWVDFGAWLFDSHNTRYEPVPVNTYRIWIRKDVYDVETIPTN
jgi:predicted membrane-bound mannosyltransferase